MKKYINIYFLTFIITGFLLSIFFLFPVHDFLTFHEISYGRTTLIMNHESAFSYVLNNLEKVFRGERIIGITFFGLIGVSIGSFFHFVFNMLQSRNNDIENFKRNAQLNIESLLQQGEGFLLEFKSSMRWDYNKSEVNKSLEIPIIKTISGFMNTEGGTLLIGVNDSGKVLGLEQDFATLKHKDKDGFEVALMTLISAKTGTNNCILVSPVFHNIDGMIICQLLVSKSSKPVYTKVGNDVKFYARTGASTRELNVKEASEYIIDHWRKNP